MGITKFEIGEEVVSKLKNKKVTILDYEIFDNLTLYYTNDGSAYPENDLSIEGFDGFIDFMTRSESDWKKINDDFAKKYLL